MRVGIIEFTALPGLTIPGKIWSNVFGPRYASVMPQAVSSWLRQAGHTVYYRVWYGQCAPSKLLPNSLDLLFLVTTCRTAGVAERYARSWKNLRTRVVACGPYPSSSPNECLRWANTVVVTCNHDSVLAIAENCHDKVFSPALTGVANGLFDIDELPLLRDRIPEICQTFTPLLPRKLQVVPLLHSIGCSNTCSFCAESNRRYKPREIAAIEDDLYTANEAFPGCLVAWHDPNWGLQRSSVLKIIEGIPNRTNRYIVELQLSHLDHRLLHRLKHAGIVFVAVGIESWTEFNDKVDIHESTPRDKMRRVVEKLHRIHRYIPHVQANMIMGFDSDTEETWQLTKEAIAQTPWCLWNVSPLYPFPGTEARKQLREEGRLLPFPPEMMTDPFITHSLKTALAERFYIRLLDLYQFRARCGMKSLLRVGPSTTAAQLLRSTGVLESIRILKTLLAHKRSLYLFHDVPPHRGGPGDLPAVYKRFRQRWLTATTRNRRGPKR